MASLLRRGLNAAVARINKDQRIYIRFVSDDGHVSDAGEVWKRREQSAENVYFKKLEQEQIKNLRKAYLKEIEYHQDEISRHANQLKEHRERLKKLVDSSEHKKHDGDDD
ncbi:hypothetical protein ACOME3_010165 [Neoechinorhynchus agilis]